MYDVRKAEVGGKTLLLITIAFQIGMCHRALK